MTELIVQIDDLNSVASVKKAIALLRGVSSVKLRKTKTETLQSIANSKDLPMEIQSLIGVIPQFTTQELEADARLSYIMSK